LFDLLHDLIAVARFLLEEGKHGGANITASSAQAKPKGVPEATRREATWAETATTAATRATTTAGKKEPEGAAIMFVNIMCHPNISIVLQGIRYITIYRYISHVKTSLAKKRLPCRLIGV
jgi:hypothetical protein